MERTGRDGSQNAGPARGRGSRFISALFLSVSIISAACTQLEKPEPEPFFAQTVPPAVQEFRWSNGKLPKSFDPALAAAPPETDAVRALYEGLTETDPLTLAEVPGVAESWSASEDFKTWTFRLRRNAKWSNGKPVTAGDFVRAWRRLVKLGDKTAHRGLLANVVGVPKLGLEGQISTTEAAEQLLGSNSNQSAPLAPLQGLRQNTTNANTAQPPASGDTNANVSAQPPAPPVNSAAALGVVAEDDLTLKVSLVLPDKEFPKLVANPIFRPIFSSGEEFVGKELNSNIVTNGPFRVSKIDQAGIVFERSGNYWNRDSIRLERVHMVAAESPEKALSAYRAGELDAITNADFSPLVLKLLSPYDDFRKTVHSALNFYEVNSEKAPFSDRRVREALSNAIERDRLSEGETEGVTRPALSFLPYASAGKAKLTQDKEKAKDLLEEAGFPDGEGFPVIKLVVNRNDTQQRVAKSVAQMWKQNLNIETEIVVRDAVEIERVRKAGEFDLIRRGVVFPTADEAANFMSVFEPKSIPPEAPSKAAVADPAKTNGPSAAETIPAPSPTASPGEAKPSELPILSEDEALYQLHAIPLYFPTSFSLVKPYVAGFDLNSLDAVTLSNVAINSDWRPAERPQ